MNKMVNESKINSRNTVDINKINKKGNICNIIKTYFLILNKITFRQVIQFYLKMLKYLIIFFDAC